MLNKSHIEWYLARGVDITVVISMRDRSISRAAKRREHCRFDAAADKEDEMALLLINEAINKYGTRGDGDAERVITVSYEAMMEFRESYLFDLYHQVCKCQFAIVSSFILLLVTNRIILTSASARNCF